MNIMEISIQRGILSGILFEENIPEENNKKFKILKEIMLNKFYLFSPIQVKILKKAFKEISEARKEGCYSCWIFNEIFIEILNEEEKAEFLEILSYTPFVEEQIYYYLKKLEEMYFLRKII